MKFGKNIINIKIIIYFLIIFISFIFGRYSKNLFKKSNLCKIPYSKSVAEKNTHKYGHMLQVEFYNIKNQNSFIFEWVDYMHSDRVIIKYEETVKIIELEKFNAFNLRTNLNKIDLSLYKKYYAVNFLGEEETVSWQLSDPKGDFIADLPPMMNNMPPISFFASLNTDIGKNPFDTVNITEKLYLTTYNYNLFITAIRSIARQEIYVK